MSLERSLSNFSRRKSAFGKLPQEVQNQMKKNRIPSGIKYLVTWIMYVLIGSYIFICLEVNTEKIAVENENWIRFKVLMRSENGDAHEVEELKDQLMLLCPHQLLLNASFDEFYYTLIKNASFKSDIELRKEFTRKWVKEIETDCGQKLTHLIEYAVRPTDHSMVDAIYYTMTLVTTIGFGLVAPSTVGSKLFCIPYALVGVPLTCILLAKSSDMLSNRILNFYETSRKRWKKHPKLLLGVVTWLFVIVGCFVFMFLPSLLFMKLEGWTLVDSFYFSFITLTTIGFGDFVAGYGEPVRNSEVYKIMIVIWIMISLGYWIFLLNFIQKAIKSNAKNLKKTFKGKLLSKQAEFLKQLISKIRQNENDVDESDYNDKLQVMTLIVESLTSRDKDTKYDKVSSTKENRKKSFLSLPGTLNNTHSVNSLVSHKSCHKEDGSKQQLPEKCSSNRFNQLLDIKVSINPESSQSFVSLMKHFGDQGFNFEKSDSSFNLPGTSEKHETFYLKDLFRMSSVFAENDSDYQDISFKVPVKIDYQKEINVNKNKEGTALLRNVNVDVTPDKVQNNFESCINRGDLGDTPFGSVLKPYLENHGDLSIGKGEVNQDKDLHNEKVQRGLISRV